jgi:ligand-binding sensor domain-containing protein
MSRYLPVWLSICGLTCLFGGAQYAAAEDQPPPAESQLAPWSAADIPFAQEYRDPFVTGTPEENDIRAIAFEDSGQPGDGSTLWLATRAGLRRLGPDGKLAAVDAALDGPVYDVACLGGEVWVATWRGLFQRTGAKWQRIEEVPGPIAAVDATAERVVAGGPDGYWQRIGERWEQFAKTCSTDVQRMQIDGADTWIATQTGLVHVTPEATTRLVDNEQIDGANVQALARAHDGSIWAGTDCGLAIYKAGRNATAGFAVADAIPNNDIRALAFDKQGRVWAGTRLGAARVAVDAPAGTHWALRHSLRWLPSNEVRDVCVTDKATYVATSAGLAVLRAKQMTLAEKAAYFEEVVRARHFREPGLMEKCYLRAQGDLSTWAPMDTDNDGGFTAMYLGSQSYRYAVTRDAAA